VSRFFLAIAAVALLVPILTRGSYRRLFGGRWYWGSLLLSGLALQILVGQIDPPVSGTHQIGFGLLIASYVLVFGFALRNALRKGMTVVAIGIAANFLAIVLNQGMAVDVPNDWVATGGVTTTVKHHPQSADDRAQFLTDIIVIRDLDEVISFGDLIMAAGILNLTFHASRKSRRKTKKVPVERNDTAEPTEPLVVDVPAMERELAAASEHVATEFLELDFTDAQPRPPSPIVAGVIEELAELRRAARDRHPSTLYPVRATPLVRESASADDDLECFEHATVVNISGAGIQGLQRERGA
jgi:hypothetical protein